MDKEWLEIRVSVSSEATEAVSGIMYNTGVKGISIEDSEDIEYKKQHKEDWDYMEENLLNFKKGAIVKGYYKEDDNFMGYFNYIKDSVASLEAFGIDKGEGSVTFGKVNEEDWENNWKKYYKTTRITSNIVISPTWEEYQKAEGELVIKMDPGMAFGTGTHETTRMCIKALERFVSRDTTVIDVGTGSGILSIAASMLGAGMIIAVDLDKVAYESAKTNVNYNNITNISVRHGNLLDVVPEKADVMVANIMADVIMGFCGEAKTRIINNGYFICSGIIQERKEDVINKLKSVGFEVLDILEEGEWVCIISRA